MFVVNANLAEPSVPALPYYLGLRSWTIRAIEVKKLKSYF